MSSEAKPFSLWQGLLPTELTAGLTRRVHARCAGGSRQRGRLSPGSDPRLVTLLNVREDAGPAGFGLFGRYDGCFDGANPARSAACPESTVTLRPPDQPDCACAPSAPPVRIDTTVCQEIQCAEGMAGVALGASCGCQGVVAGQSATPVEDAFLATGLQDCPAENTNCGAQYGDW